jgi:hypothetical protein
LTQLSPTASPPSRHDPTVRVAIAALLLGGCAKVIPGSCAGDAECAAGVRCDLAIHRCATADGGSPDGGAPVCIGAAAGDDDPACGTIDCDGLDDACRDYADVTAARCAGDGACKAANDPGSCVDPADLCAPFGCDEGGAAPACRTRCDTAADCAQGMGCPAGRCCDGGWRIFTAESTGDVGTRARVAVDVDGKVHGAWVDVTNHRIRTASNTVSSPGVWSASTVPPGTATFWYGGNMLSFVLDASGTRHLLYLEENTGNAVYAMDDGSGWTPSVVDRTSVASLAVARNGLVHLVYLSMIDSYLYYQYRATSGPTTCATPLALADSVLAMTADEAGRAHYTYWLGNIMYGEQSAACDPAAPTSAACCTFTNVVAADDSSPDTMARHAIAYDSATGRAHITYYISATGDLRHAVCEGPSCSNENIDTTGDVGRYSSIVVGVGGLHVIYYDATNGDLRYATNARGSWETFVVDSAGDVGAFASLARGPDGGLHALYYDADSQDAKYATLAPACVPGE